MTNATSTFLYTYGSEVGFLQYGIAYQVICLFFEFFMIILSASPLISKNGRTLDKKILFACCMFSSVIEFIAQPYDILKVFHPVQDKSFANIAGMLLLILESISHHNLNLLIINSHICIY